MGKKLFGEYYTGGQQTQHDGLVLRELVIRDLEALGGEGSNVELLQAFHNIYAKKLGIPAIEVHKDYDLGGTGKFDITFTKKPEKNVNIIVDEYVDQYGCELEAFPVVLHETKHAEQYYSYHKFLKHHVIPKSDFEKLMVLYYLFRDCNGESSIVPYYSRVSEFDAHDFEIRESKALMARYGFFNTHFFNVVTRETMQRILWEFKYNREGMNNKVVRHGIKAMKRDLYRASKGEFGSEVYARVKEILESGFDLEKAYERVVKRLDDYADEICLDQLAADDMGVKLALAKNTNIIYSRNRTSVNDKEIKPRFRYSKFLRDRYARGDAEFEEMFEEAMK